MRHLNTKVLSAIYILMLFMLLASATAFAGGNGHKHPHEHPMPPHDHDFPVPQDFSGEIEELFNLDRLQQALIDDQILTNTRQDGAIFSNTKGTIHNNELIHNAFEQLSDLSGLVDSNTLAIDSLDRKLNTLEARATSYAHQFTKAIAASSALDVQQPTFGGTRVSMNVGYYDGYTSVGIGIATRFNIPGDTSMGFAIATAGGETIGRAQLGISFGGAR